MTKKYGTVHQRKAGWGRARQWAVWRKSNPSPKEKLVQDILSSLNIPFVVEYEIIHQDGRPQWIDIYIPEYNLGIEIDGSHGWHTYNGKGSKMAYLDEIKARYCEDHGIRLVCLSGAIDHSLVLRVLQGGARTSESLIPF
jgi:hypothetical protein